MKLFISMCIKHRFRSSQWCLFAYKAGKLTPGVNSLTLPFADSFWIWSTQHKRAHSFYTSKPQDLFSHWHIDWISTSVQSCWFVCLAFTFDFYQTSFPRLLSLYRHSVSSLQAGRQFGPEAVPATESFSRLIFNFNGSNAPRPRFSVCRAAGNKSAAAECLWAKH